MARIAGFRLRDRWAGWDRAPFTSDSQSQIAAFEKARLVATVIHPMVAGVAQNTLGKHLRLALREALKAVVSLVVRSGAPIRRRG